MVTYSELKTHLHISMTNTIMSKYPLIALILLAFYLQTRVTKLCEDINQKLMYENTWANDFKFQLTVTNFI